MKRLLFVMVVVLVVGMAVQVPPATAQRLTICDQLRPADDLPEPDDAESDDTFAALMAEQDFLRNYADGQHDAAAESLAVISRLADRGLDFPLLDLYQGCLYLAQGDQDAALSTFTTYVQHTENADLARIVSATISTLTEDPDSLSWLAMYLSGYEDNDQDATLRQLEDLGVIPSGGELRFSEDYLNIVGTGVDQVNYALGAHDRAYVLSARVRLRNRTGDHTLCFMNGNVTIDSKLAINSKNPGTAMLTYASAALGYEDGNLYTLLINYRADTDTPDAAWEPDFDDESASLLLVNTGQRLLFYVNGAWQFIPEMQQEAAGGYILGILSEGENQCEFYDAWAVAIPDSIWQSENCTLTANSMERIYTHPDEQSSLVSNTEPDAQYIAIGQYTDAEGAVWWYLDDGHWIQAEAVEPLGWCQALPEAPVW